MESDSFKYLDSATREVLGESIPYSDCGSLPLVGDMQEAGFDIQVSCVASLLCCHFVCMYCLWYYKAYSHWPLDSTVSACMTIRGRDWDYIIRPARCRP